MIGKRGEDAVSFNLNSVVGFLLAVVGLVFVITLAVTLTNYWTGKQEARNSENFLDILVGKIEYVSVAVYEGREMSFSIRGMEDWYIMGWGKEDNGKPDKCFFDSCLCICQSPDAGGCQAGGFCRKIKEDAVNAVSLATIKYFESSLDTGGLPKRVDSDIKSSCILLPPVLIDLRIRKTADSIEVYHDYGFMDDEERINPFKREHQAQILYEKLIKCAHTLSEASRTS